MASGEPRTVALEKYRDYLRLLARLEIAPHLPVVQDRLDDSDVVQEALLRAHQALPAFQWRSEVELTAWLRRILVNTLIDELRYHGAECRDVSLEQALEQSIGESSSRLEAWLAADSPSPAERVSRQEQLLLMAAALAKLPEDERRVLEMKHLQGRSVKDIGQVLGRTREAVGGLLKRGMRRLRELLEEQK
jgi:RNA polymerase sigma-70 factor (ECF subfamily)